MVSSAFNEHQAWLNQMQMMHASHMAQSVGSSLSPLPHAPMSWALPEQGNVPLTGSAGAIDERFADIALGDEDFEQPVYRSIGGFLAADDAADSFVDFADEEPVYRSLGLAAAAPAPPTSSAEPLSAHDAERAWLESMPPLVRRQNAHGMSILVA